MIIIIIGPINTLTEEVSYTAIAAVSLHYIVSLLFCSVFLPFKSGSDSMFSFNLT